MAFLAPLIEGGFTLGLIALAFIIGLGASLRLISSWGYIRLDVHTTSAYLLAIRALKSMNNHQHL
ncbi:MAG: hypothetical protein F7C81_04835 [Desulfurococcales archaeon]|nr:hypothetical protein [Desulfurococcales archaeon]